MTVEELTRLRDLLTQFLDGAIPMKPMAPDELVNYNTIVAESRGAAIIGDWIIIPRRNRI
jgi:hypothetical protein